MRGRILEVPKLLDHIQATGALNDSSRMTGASWCRRLWRHIGSVKTLKTGVAQSRGNNSVEAAAQRLMGFRQRKGSAEQQQRRASEAQHRLATEVVSVSSCN